jgi:hypothetical protein
MFTESSVSLAAGQWEEGRGLISDVVLEYIVLNKELPVTP